MKHSSKFVLIIVCFTVTHAINFDSNDLKANLMFSNALFVKDKLRWEWAGVHVAFSNLANKRLYETTRCYIPKNMIATKIQWLQHKSEIILALPRYKEGFALTLAKVFLKDLKIPSTTPAFYPYPNWNMQEEGNCEALQSAVDMVFDQKTNLLYVLDSGFTNSLSPVNCYNQCPPKIVIIDTKKHTVFKVIDLSSLITPQSRLHHLVLDNTNKGHAYIYIADTDGYAIIVWNMKQKRGWRVVLPTVMYMEKDTRIPDELYIALTHHHKKGSTTLYLTYFSSCKMFSIRTEFLQHESGGRTVEVGIKPAKIVILGMSDNSNIFFKYHGESHIYQWNTLTPFNIQNFVLVYNNENRLLPTHVSETGLKNHMMGIESNFQDYLTDCTGSIGPTMSLFLFKSYKTKLINEKIPIDTDILLPLL